MPSTLVAKLAADDPASRERVKDGYRKEVRFYRELGERVPATCPVAGTPRSPTTARRSRSCSTTSRPAVPGVQADGCTLDQAAAAVRNLAGIHAATWCDDALVGRGLARALGPRHRPSSSATCSSAPTESSSTATTMRSGADDVDTIRRARGVDGRVGGDAGEPLHGRARRLPARQPHVLARRRGGRPRLADRDRRLADARPRLLPRDQPRRGAAAPPRAGAARRSTPTRSSRAASSADEAEAEPALVRRRPAAGAAHHRARRGVRHRGRAPTPPTACSWRWRAARARPCATTGCSTGRWGAT